MRWTLRLALSLCLAGAALPAFAQQQPVSPAVLLLRTGRRTQDRTRAAETLGATRPPGAREALERALGDRAVAVRLAAVEALRQLGDTEALPALRACARDRDEDVRRDAERVVRAFEAMPSARPAGALRPAATSAPAPPPPIDWRQVRFLVRIGALSNQARANPEDLRTMRTTIAATLASSRAVVLEDGPLPADALRRLERRQIDRYTVEGGVQSIRPGADPTSVAMRAQVSYALIAEPARTIVGSLDGAATASEPRVSAPNAPDPVPRLIQRAIEAATQGALQSLERELTGRVPRRRSRHRH